jgi:hypothetical protein
VRWLHSLIFGLTSFVDVGVEHGLKAVDDLRCADQQARIHISPFDAVFAVLLQRWACLGKQLDQIKILLAHPKTR